MGLLHRNKVAIYNYKSDTMIGKRVKNMLSKKKEANDSVSPNESWNSKQASLNWHLLLDSLLIPLHSNHQSYDLEENELVVVKSKKPRQLETSYDNDPDINQELEKLLDTIQSILYCPVDYGLWLLDLEKEETKQVNDGGHKKTSFFKGNNDNRSSRRNSTGRNNSKSARVKQ